MDINVQQINKLNGEIDAVNIKIDEEMGRNTKRD